jgi:hypothetical protein
VRREAGEQRERRAEAECILAAREIGGKEAAGRHRRGIAYAALAWRHGDRRRLGFGAPRRGTGRLPEAAHSKIRHVGFFLPL